jgi:predicted ATPase/DNA-binding CsgD family transcriptional regulator
MATPVMHGFAPAMTTFVGRADALPDVTALLNEFPLVTVTGPGGVGKTRLAAEIARHVAGRFADGAWLVELTAASDPAQVPTAVAAALGVRDQPGMSAAGALAEVLARQQLLLVLDNCEHVAGAVASLCETLLVAADDLRILATSREPLGVAGEARYRLAPLTLPAGDDPEVIGRSEAVALFTDRARRVDPRFTLGANAALAARLVSRLDGMPLAIELSAARVEALGLPQLLDRLDGRFALLDRTDHAPGATRHRSLAATADWSYRMLSQPEQRVFRYVSVFPGPFTLEAAEMVAGPTAPQALLRLVDCSLVAPPTPGPDDRARYLMLETLRGYGLDRLADAGESESANSALVAHSVFVAERAAAGLQTSAGELAAVRWLDAEDAAMRHALAWALNNAQDSALRLAVALAPWWRLRGRLADAEPALQTVAGYAQWATDGWSAARYWQGQLAMSLGEFDTAFGHFTAVRDAIAARGPSRVLAECLAGRCVAQSNLGRLSEALEDGQSALDVATQVEFPAGQVQALTNLAITAYYAGALHDALGWARQAQQIDPDRIPGGIARVSASVLAIVLTAAGEHAAAERCCEDGLARCRVAGDLQSQSALLTLLAHLDMDAGRLPAAAVHLRESIEVVSRTGEQIELLNCLDNCGHLCAATGRWQDAVTVWSALDVHTRRAGLVDPQEDALRRQEPLRTASLALGPDRIREAERRGEAMTLATAREFAAMVAATVAHAPAPQPAPLSRRERELVTLVARGETDAQIAEQLTISIRTVRSHLDRIRDKTGCRRRADLTRLALQAGLV